MKIMRKTGLLIALLLITPFNGYSMEQPRRDNNYFGYAAIIGGILLGAVAIKMLWQSQPNEPFPLEDLPPEVIEKIIQLVSINTTAESLEISAKTINSLAQINHELNEYINAPEFCLTLIKHLAEKFNCSDEEAAAALQTKEAKKRLLAQRHLQTFCIEYLYKINKGQVTFLHWDKQFDLIEKKSDKKYIDFEFTYSVHNEEIVTPLMICSSNICKNNSNGYDTYIGIIKLIATGIDVNKANPQGTTALMLASKDQRTSAIRALVKLTSPNDQELNKFIQTLPTVNIDQQDLQGNTALLYSIITTQRRGDLNPSTITQYLLNAGADPELANFNGLTPLAAAQQNGNPAIINLIQNAIYKKYGI
ncbi:MAG TPA: ankyrin repeat domain-containing protein [Candidatus Babeliales bacterium]|nr:ankyrin repeat domain-containing protein [Candidatus Babeliales bacterium]